MSDGTLRVLGLITTVFLRPSPSLLVIEEPAASIHPEALGAILDVLRFASRSMQIVVTTHSPDILDAEWINDRHLRILVWEHGCSRISRVSKSVQTAHYERRRTAPLQRPATRTGGRPQRGLALVPIAGSSK